MVGRKRKVPNFNNVIIENLATSKKGRKPKQRFFSISFLSFTSFLFFLYSFNFFFSSNKQTKKKTNGIKFIKRTLDP